MKALFVFLISFVSINAFSAERISTTLDSETPYTMEPSFTFSSLNDGSRFLGVALTTRLRSWLRVGIEGELPANFDDKAQIYTGRLLARVPLLDRENKIFLQSSVSYSYFSAPTDIEIDGVEVLPENGVTAQNGFFFNSEFIVGYQRKVTNDWTLGANVGLQYSTFENYVYNISRNDVPLYNRLSLTGAYIF